MTNTTTLNPRIELFRSEILNRLRDAISQLTGLQYGREQEERDRLERKAEAVRKVYREQEERILAVETTDQLTELAAFIRGVGKLDGADQAGTELVVGYFMEYAR